MFNKVRDFQIAKDVSLSIKNNRTPHGNKIIEIGKSEQINANPIDRKYLKELDIVLYVDAKHGDLILPSDHRHFGIFDEIRNGYYIKYKRDVMHIVDRDTIIRKRRIIHC